MTATEKQYAKLVGELFWEARWCHILEEGDQSPPYFWVISQIIGLRRAYGASGPYRYTLKRLSFLPPDDLISAEKYQGSFDGLNREQKTSARRFISSKLLGIYAPMGSGARPPLPYGWKNKMT